MLILMSMILISKLICLCIVDDNNYDAYCHKLMIRTVLFIPIERFSFENRKTKTKVITLANHIGHRQYIEPIKTRSNYMWLTQSAGKCMRARHNWLFFTSDWMKR